MNGSYVNNHLSIIGILCAYYSCGSTSVVRALRTAEGSGATTRSDATVDSASAARPTRRVLQRLRVMHCVYLCGRRRSLTGRFMPRSVLNRTDLFFSKIQSDGDGDNSLTIIIIIRVIIISSAAAAVVRGYATARYRVRGPRHRTRSRK